MRAEVFPRTPVKPVYYKRIQPGNAAAGNYEPFTYLYIGHDIQRTEKLSQLLTSGLISEHFNSATTLLKKLIRREEQLPDVIIIDVPFDEEWLREFISFVRNTNELKAIPVVYNRKYIYNGYKDRLKQTRLVDDIIDLSFQHYNLAEKVSFLKEAKEYACSLPKSRKTIKKPDTEFYLKRIIDFSLATMATIVLMPVLLLIALAIKIESRGPVFYNSYRAGRGFKIFKFYKFRTMVVDADKKLNDIAHLNQYNNGVFFKVNNDPRITRLGSFLRKTSLDELPQLLNVLKGDMSIVGNRPLPLYEAATLTTNESVERFMAPAGMTGLWQIKKRGKSDMSAEERISLDIDYARKHNLAYDFWIIANTPGALLQKSNV